MGSLHYRNLFVFGGVIFGVLYVIYAALPLFAAPLNYIFLGICAFSIGVLLAIINFPIQISMYERVEQSYLARFSSLMSAFSMAAQPLASFLFGIVSGFMMIDSIYVICGIFVVIFFAVQILNKVLWQLNKY